MLEIKNQVPLDSYTVYKIGGPARYFVEAQDGTLLKEAVRWAMGKKVPFIILGAGSNVLISDKGFDGLVIRLAGGRVSPEEERVTADAGVTVARLVAASVAAGLTGIEWAIGIPGTVGGSVRGNAGCFGGEMKDVVETVLVYDAERNEDFVLPSQAAEFKYRDSIFKRRPNWIVISAAFKLTRGDKESSQEMIREYAGRRSSSQAIGSKSAGCIFKNIAWGRKDIDRLALLQKHPEFAPFSSLPGIPAAFLIDRAGLKGKRIGAIEISPRHANYFVNHGGGTAEEVVMLVALAKERIHREYNLMLEEEIQYVGF